MASQSEQELWVCGGSTDDDAIGRLRVRPRPMNAHERMQLLGTAHTGVFLPGRPVPFGADAVAMLQAGRHIVMGPSIDALETLGNGQDGRILGA